MVTVGFIVEGPSDKVVIESQSFSDWLDEHGMLCAPPVIQVGGKDQMRGRVREWADLLRVQAGNPDKIVLLADLDPEPEQEILCIADRKGIIGTDSVDLVVVARRAIESWFLADSLAMREWTGDAEFYEPDPEITTPWERLKDVGVRSGRGPGGSKVTFAKRFTRNHGFRIARASEHPNCPSARYFVERVGALGKAGS